MIALVLVNDNGNGWGLFGLVGLFSFSDASSSAKTCQTPHGSRDILEMSSLMRMNTDFHTFQICLTDLQFGIDLCQFLLLTIVQPSWSVCESIHTQYISTSVHQRWCPPSLFSHVFVTKTYEPPGTVNHHLKCADSVIIIIILSYCHLKNKRKVTKWILEKSDGLNLLIDFDFIFFLPTFVCPLDLGYQSGNTTASSSNWKTLQLTPNGWFDGNIYVLLMSKLISGLATNYSTHFHSRIRGNPNVTVHPVLRFARCI